jgi:hypothetical protein
MQLMDGAKPHQALLTRINSKSKVHVKQHHINLLLLKSGKDAIGRRESDDTVKHPVKAYLQSRKDGSIVIHNQYCFHGCKGNIFFNLKQTETTKSARKHLK